MGGIKERKYGQNYLVRKSLRVTLPHLTFLITSQQQKCLEIILQNSFLTLDSKQTNVIPKTGEIAQSWSAEDPSDVLLATLNQQSVISVHQL